MKKLTVIGAGLAGCEAAWQAAKRGIEVELWEMKPEKFTPAHKSPHFAELVCSNSFRAAGIENAVGLLKEELRVMGSLIMECADAAQTPAGGALAVDRELFSRMVTEKIRSHPNITVREGEVREIPGRGDVIVASGPLTADALAQNIREFFGGREYLGFFDAAAPIVSFESVDMTSAYMASRYGKGTADYINCPMTREEYLAFWNELCSAAQAHVHGFEDEKVFEGCMPVEVMARRGVGTLRFGPMKPVGLPDPKTGEEPYAVVQLRKDNREGTMYNIVGFQTHLTFGEQKRVFSMIPALKDAEFLRYGVMHRNTYINSPGVLNNRYQAERDPRVSFAGQMTGVEGYVESTASGFVAGVETALRMLGEPPLNLPAETATGALGIYISSGSVGDFQPMNVNFGIMPPLGHKVRGKKSNKRFEIASRALDIIYLASESERFNAGLE